MTDRGHLRIGTSGYHYPEWCGLHYPEGEPKARWFDRYVEMFDTVEVNNTFYGVPAETTFDTWRDRAPEGFLYAVKVNREITHRRRLAGTDDLLREMVTRAERLGEHLGPFLLQLPPHWPADPDRLDRFLSSVPPGHRWAVEAREASWRCREVGAVLRRHDAAWVLHDLAGGSLGEERATLTAGWTYLRFHGPAETGGEVYSGSYGVARLQAEAERVAGWLDRGVDVYAYCNNTKDGSAVTDARTLRVGVGQTLSATAP